MEESKEQTVQIDRTPPTLQWTSEQKLVRKGFFFWFDSILTLHLQDALSGAASAEVTVGGMSGSFVPDAQSDVQIDLGERIAVRTVNVQARDAAGNTLTRTLHLIVLPGIGVFPCP